VVGDGRLFPVLWPWRRVEREAWEAAGVPVAVPWSLLAPHEAQAYRNHGQTLARLAERGGLDVTEMIAVIEGKRWNERPSEKAAIARLLELLAVTPTPQEKGGAG
jgi:hypothetical protein